MEQPPALVCQEAGGAQTETLTIEATDPVTTVNALVIMVPQARFERHGRVVEVTASPADMERIKRLLEEMARAAQG